MFVLPKGFWTGNFSLQHVTHSHSHGFVAYTLVIILTVPWVALLRRKEERDGVMLCIHRAHAAPQLQKYSPGIIYVSRAEGIKINCKVKVKNSFTIFTCLQIVFIFVIHYSPII